MEKIAQDVSARAEKIRLIIFDVDGVLTDGSLYFDADGREFKAFNSRDGHGIKMLMDSGVEVAIISGRSSVALTRRAEGLGIEHVYQGKQDKLPAFEELMQKLALGSEQVAYVGDDVVDLPVMVRVGLAVAVADAHEMVKQHSHWQTVHVGGKGAARDICELIMDAQGVLQQRLQAYLCRD